MTGKYTDHLVTLIKLYFQEKFDLELTSEEAEGYLDCMADVYLSFVCLQCGGGRPSRQRRTDEPAGYI